MLMREIEAQDDAALAQIIRQALEAANLARPGTAYFDPELEHLSRYYQEAPDRGYVVAVSDDGVVLGGAGYAPYAPATSRRIAKVYLTPPPGAASATNCCKPWNSVPSRRAFATCTWKRTIPLRPRATCTKKWASKNCRARCKRPTTRRWTAL